MSHSNAPSRVLTLSNRNSPQLFRTIMQTRSFLTIGTSHANDPPHPTETCDFAPKATQAPTNQGIGRFLSPRLISNHVVIHQLIGIAWRSSCRQWGTQLSLWQHFGTKILPLCRRRAGKSRYYFGTTHSPPIRLGFAPLHAVFRAPGLTFRLRALSACWNYHPLLSFVVGVWRYGIAYSRHQ